MHNATATATQTTTRNRRAPKRPDQLAAEAATDTAAATLAETTAAAKPALSPDAQARLEKERAKLVKEQRAAAARARRIAALERGEELPSPTKGLPQVVKMNELGALARQLHRAHLLVLTEDARRVMGEGGASDGELSSTAYALRAGRDRAIRQWTEQHAQRAAAGAADNETLHPLGLEDDGDGGLRLVEKAKPKATADE